MRVIWITHNYPRYAGDLSGGFLHPLAIALRELDVDVRIVAPSDAGQGGRDELDGVPIHRMRYGTTAEEHLAYRGTMAGVIKSPRSLLALNRLRVALRAGAQQELDDAAGDALVHAHWWVPGGWAAPGSAPLVLTCHGTDVRLLDRARMVAWLARPVFRRARVVTTVSRDLAAVIQRRTGVAVADDCIQPMPIMGVDREWSDGSGDVVVVCRLTRQKRVGLALDAMAIARRGWTTRRLTVVGNGPMRAALER
ncbi:MAG: glycosyltransferase, partial [Gemmatimonadales bacterium]